MALDQSLDVVVDGELTAPLKVGVHFTKSGKVRADWANRSSLAATVISWPPMTPAAFRKAAAEVAGKRVILDYGDVAPS